MKIENLWKAYGEKQVLSGFSADLEPGKLYVLTGPSGSGKTTLLHILLGLAAPDAGTVLQDVRWSAVFQENRLIPRRTAVQNLRPVCPADRARTLLKEILPPDCLERSVETLSGGMQRRVAIARAMAAESDVILMDEPFTGLDAGTAGTVMAFILRNQHHRTILIATHQPELVAEYGPEHIVLQE